MQVGEEAAEPQIGEGEAEGGVLAQVWTVAFVQDGEADVHK